MRIKYKAPLYDKSGLGEASRLLLNVFYKSGAIDDIGVEVIDISPNPMIYRVPKIDELKKYNTIDTYDICIIFCPPYQFYRFIEKNKTNIGYTMWETQNIPKHFEDNIGLLKALFVPTNQNKTFFDHMNVPIYVLPITFFENKYQFTDLRNKYDNFTFYSVYEWTERKGPIESLEAYFIEFMNNKDVNFILKTSGSQNDISNKIRSLKALMKLPQYPNLEIITADLPNDRIKKLHKMSHCYVGASRGEGWNLPLMEAVLYGNMSISTNTGCVDYIDNKYLFRVDGSFEPVIGSIYFEHFNAMQNWIIPSVNSIRNCMRTAYTAFKNGQFPDINHWKLINEQVSNKISATNITKNFDIFMNEIIK